MHALSSAALGTILVAVAAIAALHAVAPASPTLDWGGEPWVALSLAVVGLWYAIGLARLRRRGRGTRIAPAAQIAAFVAAMAIVASALLSPLDGLADQLFSAHMVQHLLLLLAAPPLFVYARPAVVLLWAFPAPTRKRIGRALIALGARAALRFLMHPVIVWVLASGVFVFWHLPGPYRWALGNDGIHALEHLSFVVTALMWWTIVIEPIGTRRLGYGGTFVFIAATAILSGMPGALIVLAPRAFYAGHGAAAWGLTPLQDQQLAGILMWIPGGLAYLAAASAIFMKWLRSEEALPPRLLSRNCAATSLAILLAFVLTSCDGEANGSTMSGGSAKRGAALIRSYGCGTCHLIPGIRDANGLVGPPLTQFAERIYVAGVLRNTPDNLERWLEHPQAIVPGNAMPDMGIDEPKARDIAAYLYRLH